MELARLASSKQQASTPCWSAEEQGSRNRKKSYHAIRDGFPQFSREQLFFRSDPHRSETVIFGPFGPRALREIRCPGQKQKNEGKKLQRCPGWLSATFFQFTFRPTGPPLAGKTRNTRILGHFGLGRLLALRAIPGPGRKRKVAGSRC